MTRVDNTPASSKPRVLPSLQVSSQNNNNTTTTAGGRASLSGNTAARISNDSNSSGSGAIGLAISPQKVIQDAAKLVISVIPILGGTNVSRYASASFYRQQQQHHNQQQQERDFPTDNDDFEENDLEEYPLHKACFEFRLLEIQRLLQASSNPLMLLRKPMEPSGYTPLNVACRFDAPSEIIEYLLETEYQCLLATASPSRKRSSIRRIVKETTTTTSSSFSFSSSSSLYLATVECGYLPIHFAVQNGAMNSVKLLLEADDKYRLGGNNNSINTLSRHNSVNEDTPLHMAVSGDDVEMVQFLLEFAAQKQNTNDMVVMNLLGASNAQGFIPLHLALQKHGSHRLLHNNNTASIKETLWSALLEYDVNKKTLVIRDNNGHDALRFFLERPNHVSDEFVDAHLAKTFVQYFLDGQPVNALGLRLHRLIARNPTLQNVINETCSHRLASLTYFADFYAHILTVTMFYLATEQYLALYSNATQNDQEDESIRQNRIRFNAKDGVVAVQILYFLSAYFILRQLFQLYSAKKLYWKEIWNYIEIARITTIIGSTQFFASTIFEKNLAPGFLVNVVVDEAFFRHFLLVTGILSYMGLISAMASTFLPFAHFVGGVSAIISKLIPFIVCTALALCCAAYGYWIGGFTDNNDNEFPTIYSHWLYDVFLTALSGPSRYADLEHGFISRIWWTVIYAILIQILLLNVLIAIVSSEWDRIGGRTAEVFWRYRLAFLAGVLPAQRFFNQCQNSPPARCLSFVFRVTDSLDRIKLNDSIEWDVYPHSVLVTDQYRHLYWDRKAFLAHLEATNSHASSSDEVDWNEEIGVYRSFEADLGFCETFLQCLVVVARFFGYCIGWLIFFLLGWCSLGLLWPRQVRRFFYGASPTKVNKQGKRLQSKEEAKLNECLSEVATLKMANENMALKMDELNSKVDKLVSMIALHAEMDEDQHKSYHA